MCVVNNKNCTSLEGIAHFAIEVGAEQVWFKPMEVHGEYHKKIIPDKSQLNAMAKSLKNALDICDAHQLIVMERNTALSVIKEFEEMANE
jgi:hypothetical protein